LLSVKALACDAVSVLYRPDVGVAGLALGFARRLAFGAASDGRGASRLWVQVPPTPLMVARQASNDEKPQLSPPRGKVAHQAACADDDVSKKNAATPTLMDTPVNRSAQGHALRISRMRFPLPMCV
jgi:hypothetical protein